LVRVNEESQARETKTESKTKRKLGRKIGIGLILLLVLLWFLPIILAKTPLLNWAANRFGNLKGRVAIQSASLGWFTAPSIEGIELRDERDRPVVENLSVSGSTSLVGMMLNSSNLGTFTLDKPKLTLHVRPDGSNLEDVIANYLKGPSSSKKVGVQLVVNDASVEIVDETTKQKWQVEKFSLDLKMPAKEADPLVASASARFPNADPQQSGKLEAKINLSLASDSAKPLNELALKIERFPLEILEPAFSRFSIDATTAGYLYADLHTAMGDKANPAKTTVEGSVETENLAVAMPALGKNPTRITNLRMNGRGSVASGQIDIDRSSFECDAGDATISGSLRLKDETGKSNLTLAGLMRQSCELNGRVDLARLAALFPTILHVREQTQITSGEIRASFVSRPQENPQSKSNAYAWQGEVHAANLTAVDNGRPISWPKPLDARFAAHEEPQGIVVEHLQCDSDFLTVTGGGTSDDLTASATFDLKQLADRLGQFVEMGGYQLAGQGRIESSWKRDAQQLFDASSTVELRNIVVGFAGQRPWQEPSLTTTLSARGKTDFSPKNTSIDVASVGLQAGQDQFHAQLLKPVRNLTDGGVWPLRVVANGQMATWLSRAAAFAPLGGYQAGGTCSLEAQMTASMAAIEISNAKIRADQLAIASPSFYLNEPQLELTASGSWVAKDRRLNIVSTELKNYTLSASVRNFVLSTPEKGPFELSGAVNYQGDLNRLQHCFADRAKPASFAIGGIMTGNAQFKQTGGVIQCSTANEVSNLAVASASGQQFQEQKIAINAAAQYDNKTKLMKIDKAEIQSSVISAGAIGQIASKDQTTADIKSAYLYNFSRLSDLLEPSFGKKIRFYGSNDGSFTWNGPLSLEKGQAATELKWDRASLYGFDLGPATVKPKLAGGVLSIEPMQVPVSDGKLFLAPKVRLAPEPMELTMPKGILAQQVQITTEMCSMFLMYIAPIMADVSEAHGAFSIELEDCRLPLANPKMGALKGKFIVHNVEIGPGPLIRELAILMDRETPAKLRQQSVVNFQMAQGRIYHDNMELIFPDFTIRTQGSVGIDDQSLSMQADMPIPPKWLVNNPAAPALRNQTIRIPIGGTLSRPQLDRAKLEEYTRQFIQKAAGNLLEEGLNRGLDQLFRKPKQ
jgi:hypothetical protein